MRIWKIPDQIIRIAIIFIIMGLALVVARFFLVPKSFGKLGHYRAEALVKEANGQIKYAGAESCNECHSDIVEEKAVSFHKNLSCEGCHGPAYRHIMSPEDFKPIKPVKREDCVICHGYLASRPTGFPQIIEIVHNPDEECITCHNPHDPTPPVVPEKCSACHANIARPKSLSAHAKLKCQDCHNVPDEHRQNPRIIRLQLPTKSSTCLHCHAQEAKSAISIPRIDALHYPKYLCWQCHYPHLPEVSK